jgi:hypothetical protein
MTCYKTVGINPTKFATNIKKSNNVLCKEDNSWPFFPPIVSFNKLVIIP